MSTQTSDKDMFRQERKFERVRIYGGTNPPLTLAQFTYRVGFWTMGLVVFATVMVAPWWGTTAAVASMMAFGWLDVDDRARSRWGR